jgi:hypothetical protein
MPWKRPKFTTDGLVNVNHMLGPWEQYDRGSERWAEAIAAQLQHSVQRTVRDGDPVSVLLVLEEAFKESPHPWAVWPEEANSNPEVWVRLVTGKNWQDVEHLIRTRKGPEAWEPFAHALAQWEAEHRTHGGDRSKSGDTTLEQCISNEARGIRRRLLKRANDGDEQASSLVEQLTAGRLTVNQAAIAAGMRQRYFRVPLTDDPAKVAASIKRHLSAEQIAALKASL